MMMSEPSKEAMAAAMACIFIKPEPDADFGEVTVVVFEEEYTYSTFESEVEDVAVLQSRLATALDAHTADLRRKIEALKARVAEHEDLITVWGWIQRYGGVLNENGVVLYSPNEIATRIDLIHNGKDWLPTAAEWVRSQSE